MNHGPGTVGGVVRGYDQEGVGIADDFLESKGQGPVQSFNGSFFNQGVLGVGRLVRHLGMHVDKIMLPGLASQLQSL